MPPSSSTLSAPKAEIIKTEIIQHGVTRQDDYAWLKDENWKQVIQTPEVLSKNIRNYLEAENEYLTSQLQDTKL